MELHLCKHLPHLLDQSVVRKFGVRVKVYTTIKSLLEAEMKQAVIMTCNNYNLRLKDFFSLLKTFYVAFQALVVS